MTGYLFLLVSGACSSPSKEPSADTAPMDSVAPDSGADSATDSGVADSGGGDTNDSGADTSDSGADTSDSGADTGSHGGTGVWSTVSIFLHRICGLSASGRGACWGLEDGPGGGDIPAGEFVGLSKGAHYGCAQDATGAESCWGCEDSNWCTDVGQTEPLPEAVTGLDAGYWQKCGINAKGALVCNDIGYAVWVPPTEGTYTQVSVGMYMACALTTEGAIACWAFARDHDLTGDGWAQVSAGYYHICGLRDTGEAQCWQYSGEVEVVEVPEGYRFTRISAGNQATCGITTDTGIVCWADWYYYPRHDASYRGVVLEAPTTTGWADVSVGSQVACALAIDGHVECWGAYGGWGEDEIPDAPE